MKKTTGLAKTMRQSLVELQAAVGRSLQLARSRRERAVLVTVEFVAERRKLTSAARMASDDDARPALLLNRFGGFDPGNNVPEIA
jgi:hypothetical protein